MSARRWRWAAAAGFALSLAGMVVVGITSQGRLVDRANRLLSDGSPERALAVIAAGAAEDARVLLVRGNALLQVGELEAASEDFAAAAARADDPELRRRALHNLAVAHLESASRGPVEQRRLHARAAAAAARDALRLQADVPATRWNLALALRLAPPEDPERNRNAETDGAPSSAPASGSSVGSAGELTPQEARRILDGLGEEAGDALSDELARRLGRETATSTRRGPPW